MIAPFKIFFLKLYFIAFLLSMILGCNKQNIKLTSNLSLEDRSFLNSFFKELLLEHGGAYTLFSDKPITIEPLFYYDEEDLKKQDKYLKQHPELSVIQTERNLESAWKRWKELAHKFELNNYILTEIHPDNFSQKESLLIFLNIKAAAIVLKKHYDDFRRIVNYDFDPIQVIFELKNGNDLFWQKVLSHHALCGILLGYGYKNSWFFNWYMSDPKNPFLNKLHQNAVASENSDPRIVSKFYVCNHPFRLPIFACLDEKSSKKLINVYVKERQKIVQFYQNKDFLEATLQQLTSDNIYTEKSSKIRNNF